MKNKQRLRKYIQNIILLFISCLITVIIFEFALRIIKDDKYYIWNPNLKATLQPKSQLFPGINGDSHFIVNSNGFRGDEIPEEFVYKIVTIGGSTTECVYLDQEEAWPYLMQNNLSKSLNKLVWVGNAGKSGMTTYENIVQTKEILRQDPDIDLIIMLVGINDFQRALTIKDNYRTGKIDTRIYNRAFDLKPDFNPDFPFYKRTELWRLLSKLKFLFVETEHKQDSYGKNLQTRRNNRQSAKKILDKLPDLTQALNDYEKNLKKIIELTNHHKAKIVFITQPVIWNKNMPDEYHKLCWFGWVGNYQVEKGKEYFSIEALEIGMKLYNERLRQTCKENNISLIDLEDKLPKDLTVYYDDCHYNENGSRLVAELISKEVEKILE